MIRLIRTRKRETARAANCKHCHAQGFTMLENVIALTILMVVGLGVAGVFFYAMKNNAGASDREIALAIAQQRLERFRISDFDDAALLATATNPTPETIQRGNRSYAVVTTIVDSAIPAVGYTTTLKTITVTVTPKSATTLWGGSPVMLIDHRSDTSVGPYFSTNPKKKIKKAK